MRKTNTLNAMVLIAALLAIALVAAAPVAAKPGWSMSNHPVLGLSDAQREQISHLRAAYHEQLKALDWSVTEDGHAPETLREARELRLALRAEVRELLSEEQRQAMDATRRGTCPHSGKATPVRVQQQTTTLFL